MRRKKVLVHGTLDTLQKFFDDTASRDFNIVAILSNEPEKIDAEPLEVFAPKNLPTFVLKLVDGIVLTDVAENDCIKFFLDKGIDPIKILIWSDEMGWGQLTLPDSDGTAVAYLCGLAFHIRNDAEKDFFEEIHQRLQNQWQVKNLEPQQYPAVLEQQYQQRMKRPLDLNNPQTFTEKLQWLKLYDATPLKSRLADKYLVRRWVADKIGEGYSIPLLGVWDNFDDIDFDELPDQFVLKCNHGSGMNIVVRDKKTFDKRQSREIFNALLATDFAALFFELHYTRIHRKIIAEKFMQDGNESNLKDYRFWCFCGKPVICGFDDGSINQPTDFFDMNWNVTDIEKSNYPNSAHPELIPPPKNFELMKKLAATLAEGFAFVRVDFYEIDGKVYFGEMTFTPDAGNFSYKSAGTDEYLGSLLKLPTMSPPPQL